MSIVKTVDSVLTMSIVSPRRRHREKGDNVDTGDTGGVAHIGDIGDAVPSLDIVHPVHTPAILHYAHGIQTLSTFLFSSQGIFSMHPSRTVETPHADWTQAEFKDNA